MLYRLHNELKLPVYCLLDNDPWGYYIYSVIKQGRSTWPSSRSGWPFPMPLPRHPLDRLQRCGLSDSVKISLNDNDRKRAKQIAGYPGSPIRSPGRRRSRSSWTTASSWKSRPSVSKDISYVTEEYTPQRLADSDWLD